MRYLLLFAALALSTSALADEKRSIVFEGYCEIQTAGKSGSDVHILSHGTVSAHDGEKVELYRSSKAIFRISANKFKFGETEFSELNMEIISLKTNKLLTYSSLRFKGTTTPEGGQLVAPNLTDIRGPAYSEIACLQPLPKPNE